ncbi:MAG: helix-turn-helix domain-containing protein, partial [Frankia sp.]|nr:helix-turn-helix domain-containing protein [Frankia sp.]
MDAAVPGGQFPPGLGRLLSAELASVGEDIIAAIAAEVPAYARPLEGRFGQGVRIGVAEALRRFLAIVDGAAGDPADAAASRQVYVRLGEGEFRAGRSLDNLLAAYRVGTRVAWRRFAEVARQRGGLDGAGLVTLGETLFVYIDSVCAASAEGYALAQSADASARERLWDRVGELLLSGGDPAAVAELVQAASLPLPERLAAVLVPVPADGQRAPGLPTGCPTTARGADLWLFVNGDDVRGPRLSGQLAGRSAVVGPTVPWQRAAASAERVRLARDALDRGLLPAPVPDGAPLFTDDHLAALLLVRDPDLLADLARRRLAPLAGVPRRSRGRLALTLLHWLTLRGQRGLVAQRLHIHPQTVRYRVLRLRELFGDALDDPDARFELELVLRAGAASGAWADDGGDGRAGGQWADEDLWGDGEARPGDGGARTGDGEAGGRLPHARQRPAGTAGVGTAGTGTA